MNILQRIFTDYYEEIKYTLHPRSTEMENIDKMINCGDPSFGGAMYGCPHCGKLKFLPIPRRLFLPLPAETSIPWNSTSSCLLNLLMSSTATVFLLLMKIFVTFFLEDFYCLLDSLFHSVASVVISVCSSK